MPRLTHFPPKFNHTIVPDSEHLFGSFFYWTRKFVEEPESADYSVRENVHNFNLGLTNVIHKDISEAKSRFHKIRSVVEAVEEAFESLDEAYKFFNDFDEFLDVCLSTNYKSSTFQEYVKDLKMNLDRFKKIIMKTLKSCAIDLVWPAPKPLKEIINPVDINEKFNMIWMEHTEPLPIDRHTPKSVIKNFKLAILLVDELENKVICTRFDNFLEWLKHNKTYLNLYQEFKTKKANFLSKVKAHKAEYIDEINFMKKQKEWQPDDLEKVAERSLKAVSSTMRSCPQSVIDYREMFQDCVLNAYERTLKLVERFNSNLETVDWNQKDSQTMFEYRKAHAAGRIWMHALMAHMDRLRAKPFEKVLQELPYLPACISYFTFRYHTI